MADDSIQGSEFCEIEQRTRGIRGVCRPSTYYQTAKVHGIDAPAAPSARVAVRIEPNAGM